MTVKEQKKKEKEQKFCLLGHWCYGDKCMFWDNYTEQCFILRFLKTQIYQRPKET